jgi:predicted RNase H-like HicB family nuclease
MEATVDMATRQYVVVVEEGMDNWSAYVPDVWGCVTTGRTRAEVERNIQEALTGHFAVMAEHGEAIPAPGTWTAVVEVQMPDEAPLAAATDQVEAR